MTSSSLMLKIHTLKILLSEVVFIRSFEKWDVLCYGVCVRPSVHKLFHFRLTPPTLYQNYAALKIIINFSFLANSYSSHPIQLKIDLFLDHGVEQNILFQGYSTLNINRVIPL